MSMTKHVTPYPDIDVLLDGLLDRMQRTLGKNLVGLYLYGSLVTGDFSLATSDIDLLAVTLADINGDEFARLQRMHDDIAAKNPQWDGRIEVQYLAVDALQTFKTQRSQIAVISPGEPFNIKDAGIDWLINWHLVRERGVVLFGSDPGAFIPPISKSEFVQAARDHARYWGEWAGQPRDRTGQSYAILTLCRALAASQTGEQLSKDRAVLWVAERFPEWTSLVHNALIWRQTWQEASIDHAATFPETVQFIHFAIEQIDVDERSGAFKGA